jgi:hypothetical protein
LIDSIDRKVDCVLTHLYRKRHEKEGYNSEGMQLRPQIARKVLEFTLYHELKTLSRAPLFNN